MKTLPEQIADLKVAAFDQLLPLQWAPGDNLLTDGADKCDEIQLILESTRLAILAVEAAHGATS